MAWNPNIPQATDTLAQSQSDILGNFVALNALFNNGIQPVVILPVQGADKTTAPGQLALYSKLGITGSLDLFIRAPSNGTIVDATGSAQSTNGWSYLPSGLLVKWGTVSGIDINSTGPNNIITFPIAGNIPVFNNVFSVQVTCGLSTNADHNQALQVISFSTTIITIYVKQLLGLPLGNTQTVYYFAIGN